MKDSTTLLLQKQNDIEAEDRMQNIFKNTILHFIFIIFITYIAYSNQTSQFYHQNRAASLVLSNTSKIKTVENLWNWIENFALPKLFPLSYYNDRNRSKYDLKFTLELNHMRFSSPRLFQQRMRRDPCKIQRGFQEALGIHNCFRESYKSNKESRNFSKNWKDFNFNYSHPAFSYSKIMNGYSVSLKQNFKDALKIVQDLKQAEWIDHRSRFISLELTVLVHETISNMEWKFERTTMGSIKVSTRCESIKLYRYTGASGIVSIVIELLSIISWILLTIRSIYRYFKYTNCPNSLLTGSLICYGVSMILYIWRTIKGVEIIDTVMNSRKNHVDLSIFFNIHYYFMIFIGLCGFFGELHILSILKLSRTISILVCTLRKSRTDLLSIGFCCLVFFFGYACWGYLMFGLNMKSYRSFLYTCYSLLDTVFGHLDFQLLSETSGSFGKFYIISYGCLMLYLILNIFITTLNEFLTTVKNNPSILSHDHKALEYLIKVLKGFLTKAKNNRIDEKSSINETKYKILSN